MTTIFAPRTTHHAPRTTHCIPIASCLVITLALTVLAASDPVPPPATPREFFNAGTRQLRAGKFREAEASLEAVLASQNERLQPPALYNLGLVRFAQGVEQYKKGPEPKQTLSRGRAAGQQADAAIGQAEEALSGNDVQKMVAAYMRGQGARKELQAATRAVMRALKVYGVVLAHWERASGDFKSADEMNSADTNALYNAGIVDRCIAGLVDSLREMQQCSNGMGGKKQQLGDALKKLKGRIPAPDMPPGAAEEDEEEEDQPLGPQPGQEEGPSKDGQEMRLSPEQASWLLDAYKLDTERRLPMGQSSSAQPKDRSRPTW